MRPVDLLSSVIPDELTLKRLLIRFPFLAAAIMPILTSAACNFVPPAQAQTGAQPEKPTTFVTNEPVPTPKDYGVVIDDSVDNAAKVLLTVEADATSEPTPTSTNTPEPSPTAKVSESMTKIVFSAKVYKRLGPGTNYGSVGFYGLGEVLDFSRVVGKVVSGGYTWLKLDDGDWFALVLNKVSYDKISVDQLPLATIDIAPPAPPTRTPTREAPIATPQPVLPATEVAPTPTPVEVAPPATSCYFSNWPGFGPDYNFANGGGYDLYPSNYVGLTDGGTVLKGPPTIENGNMVFGDYEFKNYTIVQISEVLKQPNGTLQLRLNTGLFTVDQNTSYIAVFNNFLPGNALGYKPADFKGVIPQIFTPNKILGVETQGDKIKTVLVKIN